ncbi:retrovirus-related pol polyprotein from transposon TNT 1-94, partial [Tanacetum coccineum]
AIRIFIANAATKDMIIYQMDVKNAFLNGDLQEEVFAPRAWYDTLSKFLLANNFFNGAVDPTYQGLSQPKKHFEAIKRVFRYLKGTINMGLWYPKDNAMSLTAYADADHADVKYFKKKYVGSAHTHRSKHIDIRHHFIREQVENRVVELYFVETNYQLADILTKALPRERFEFLLPRLGMKSLTPETLRRLQEGEDE